MVESMDFSYDHAKGEGYTTISIDEETYQALEKIADKHGVTVDQYAEIYFTGFICGCKELAAIAKK